MRKAEVSILLSLPSFKNLSRRALVSSNRAEINVTIALVICLDDKILLIPKPSISPSEIKVKSEVKISSTLLCFFIAQTISPHPKPSSSPPKKARRLKDERETRLRARQR